MKQSIRQEFLNPSEEFSVIPFWFWNDELSEDEIASQMRQFKEKGIDGFVIHPRLGLSEKIGYLTDTYFHYVKYAVAYAKELDMHVVLYDEAMYPSGSAHGMVVKNNIDYASRGLLRTTSKEEAKAVYEMGGEKLQGKIIAENIEEGKLWYYAMVPSKGTIRGVYYGEDDGEANAPWSADLLNPMAVKSFLDITYEAYYRQLKEYFGSTVWAMFTDEPNILGRCAKEGLIPWSDGILEEFQNNGGSVNELRYLFEQNDTKEATISKTAYGKTIHDRMSKSYYKQLGDWCRFHGVGLTGHPEKSMDIGYLQYFDIPCQDIVWRFVAPEEEKYIKGNDSIMGKCSADSARHHGKRKNGNECFGCCGALDDPYRFTKEDMLWYCNWLFVRGVNVIYPHAFYYSVRGKRKEERPPEVGMRSSFWAEYLSLSTYCKRMCGLLTDAVNQTEIAVLCQKDTLSWEIAKPLLEHQIEFNYLEDELIPKLNYQKGKLHIQKQTYRIIICEKKVYDEHIEAFLKTCEKKGIVVLSFENEEQILKDIRAVQQVDVEIEQEEKNLRYTHLLKEGQHYYIFTNEGQEEIKNTVRIPNRMITEVCDAMEGNVVEVEEESYRLRLKPCSSIILFAE